MACIEYEVALIAFEFDSENAVCVLAPTPVLSFTFGSDE